MKPSRRHSIELDISRLMDPSYHSHIHSSEPAKAYVDRRGELHDPDFQYFPVYPGSGKSRRGRRISDSYRAQEDEDELEQEEESQAQQYHRRRPRSAQSHTTRDSTNFYSSSIPSSSSSSPSSLSSPLPSTPYTSVFEEKPHHHHHLLPKRFRSHSSGATSAPCSLGFDSSSVYEYDNSERYIDSEDVDLDLTQPEADRSSIGVHSESYSQSMKKQWLAVSLSVRFRLFRAKRRASSLSRRS
eukprot:GHVO01021049.1.p1 GENE.GHVO01021049.1~~GHVO01021049.1.p1  ORF type:complete len:257 (+),score=0.99 GHVO01021049.1:47-772(+)